MDKLLITCGQLCETEEQRKARFKGMFLAQIKREKLQRQMVIVYDDGEKGVKYLHG